MAGATRKPAAKRKATAGSPRKKVSQISGVDKVLRMLPFSEEEAQRVITWIIFAVLAALAFAAAQYAGLTAAAYQQYAALAAKAGFQVQRIEVTGMERVDQLRVYQLVLAEKDRAMPLVDIDKVRMDLLQYGWIKDARVARRLPDTLAVEIDANRQTVALSALLEKASALKSQVSGATWVGNRRWDIQFQTGETLALPEGEAAAAKALLNFARMDGVHRLLGRDLIHFDLRDPDRAYFRKAQKVEPAKVEKTEKVETNEVISKTSGQTA